MAAEPDSDTNGPDSPDGSNADANAGTESVGRRSFLSAVAGSAALAGTSATANAQEGGGGGGGGGSQTIAMTDSLVYEPAEVTIAPGTTVTWENTGSIGHTVTAYQDQIPQGAQYFASGGFSSESEARSNASAGDIPGGETYEHTFQTLGTYEYFCIPHESAGMVGSIEVAEGGGGGGAAAPVVGQSAQMLGVATSIALAATLGLAYFFMRFGGDYR